MIMDKKTLIIQTKLSYDNDFLFRCVLELYKLQEEDERAYKLTRHTNGVGFNKADGQALSDFAVVVQAKNWKAVADYIDDARKRMLKYAGQLSKILTDVD